MRTEPNDPTQSGPVLAVAAGAVRLTRNEIAGLSAKAARGAGMDWGLAEEAGFAASWLQGHGIDGAEALLMQLERMAGRPWLDLCPIIEPGHWRAAGAAALCPVALGATLGDFCDLAEGALAGGLTVGPVSAPVMLLPFLSQIARRRGISVALAWQGAALTIDGAGAMAGDLNRLAALTEAVLHLTPATDLLAPETSRQAPTCRQETLQRLDRLAMNTTVPPSQRSRADAGAGGDND